MSARPRSMLAVTLAAALLGVAGSGLAALSAMASSAKMPTFGMRYGSNPRRTNGGRVIGAAAQKRAARRRRNLRKHPRCQRGRRSP